MRNYKYLLLVSTCLLFNNNTHATELDLTFNSSSLPFGINATLHTHTSNVELKPILVSSNAGIKLAAVCSLGSGSGGCDDENFNLDNTAQCRDEGFVNSCSSGSCMDKSCPYTNTYGKCISEKCPTNSSFSCTGAVVGKNACGNNCYQCCSDVCSSGSQSYNGAYASTTGCGNRCYNCNTTCPSGSRNYSGSYASTNQCGNTCYNCSTSCPSGYSSSNPGGCYDTSSNECGGTCYRSKACCDNSCPSGYSSGTGSGCSYGAYSSSTGCGGSCYQCKTCSETCSGQSSSCNSSQVQTSSCSLKCGSGTRYSCRSATCSDGGYVSSCPSGQSGTAVSYKGNSCYSGCKNSCSPSPNESGCSYGTQSCSNGCGGTRTCCKANPCSRGEVWYNGSCCSPMQDDPYWIDDCNCTYCSQYATVANGCGGTYKSCRRQTVIKGCSCY